MKTKLIIIISLFSFIISLFLGYCEGINYNFPFLIIQNEELKIKIHEFAGTDMANHFLTDYSAETQSKVIDIWDYKNKIDSIVNLKEGINVDSLEFKNIFKTKIYSNTTDLIKVVAFNNYDSNNSIAHYYYFQNNKLCLNTNKQFYKLLKYESQLVNQKSIETTYFFIKNDTLIFGSRIPYRCTLGGQSEQRNVYEAYKWLNIFTNNKLKKFIIK